MSYVDRFNRGKLQLMLKRSSGISRDVTKSANVKWRMILRKKGSWTRPLGQ